MAGVISRESYFETGLDVLSDLGYGGLKLAEVCNRLGVTTGSFYHYFTSWSAYTRELVANWMQERTVLVIEFVRTSPTRVAESTAWFRSGSRFRTAPRPRSGRGARSIRTYTRPGRRLTNSASTSCTSRRWRSCRTTTKRRCSRAWAVYLLVGYEQATLPRDNAALAWIAKQLTRRTRDGRFASVHR